MHILYQISFIVKDPDEQKAPAQYSPFREEPVSEAFITYEPKPVGADAGRVVPSNPKLPRPAIFTG